MCACGFCRFADGAQFARSYNWEYANRWRNVGVVAAYAVFNFAAVAVLTWMYLGGRARLRGKWAGTKR